MSPHIRIHAESILAGTAEIEDGCVRNAVEGDSGKESVLPVVEVLDKVRDILPVFKLGR